MPRVAATRSVATMLCAPPPPARKSQETVRQLIREISSWPEGSRGRAFPRTFSSPWGTMSPCPSAPLPGRWHLSCRSCILCEYLARLHPGSDLLAQGTEKVRLVIHSMQRGYWSSFLPQSTAPNKNGEDKGQPSAPREGGQTQSGLALQLTGHGLLPQRAPAGRQKKGQQSSPP